MRHGGAAAIALTAVLIAGCAPGADDEGFRGQDVAWAPCHSEEDLTLFTELGGDRDWLAALECGTLTVPLDHDDPGGRTLDLAVARHPAEGGAGRKQGSLVVNYGGPGVSGLAGLDTPRFSQDVRDAYDLVSFDPRGVGASEGFACGDWYALDHARRSAGASDPLSTGAEQLRTLENAARDYAESCRDVVGDDFLAHIGTVGVVGDLDLLRDALGEETLDYVGYSYGTRIGALYADTFPDRTGSMVLDSPVLLDGSGLDTALGRANAFRDTWGMFTEYCTEAEPDCPLTDPGTATEFTEEAAAELQYEPVLVDGVGVNGDMFSLLLTLALPRDEQWDDLSALFTALAQDDGPAVEDGIAELYEGAFGTYRDRDPAPPEPGAEHVDAQAALTAISCADRRDPTDVWEYRDAARVADDVAPLLGPDPVWDQLPCAHWPDTEEIPDDADFDGAPPAVVVGTVGDPVTPYSWAEDLHRAMPGSDLITYNGAGHTLYGEGRNACVDDAVDAYLLQDRPPRDALTCHPDH
ncbi:alpha/beta fold hydrolase [Nocardiopsis sp. HNM0947]|uniref:Alpha/beta fold hydrolase n=1 Tax=Nocardiopsis coralli TaxID=2772213 RepID=A0ABR9P7A0_9ACTN|nr:alpha/beta hydrolase [Nocardiopsis coralli]MBE2999706.1 alpha/beta fold hydrolase [Nocardiopsis coralli]